MIKTIKQIIEQVNQDKKSREFCWATLKSIAPRKLNQVLVQQDHGFSFLAYLVDQWETGAWLLIDGPQVSLRRVRVGASITPLKDNAEVRKAFDAQKDLFVRLERINHGKKVQR